MKEDNERDSKEVVMERCKVRNDNGLEIDVIEYIEKWIE